MNYKEARSYLDGINKFGSVLGLESIERLLKELGDPHKKVKNIHIAGTNGKGSVLAFVSSILIHAGYRTGCYSSPGVFDYREIIRINGINISEENICSYTEQIKEACDMMVEKGYAHPTIFEVETAMAFLHFADQKCDIAVLETGLGGLLDATNVVSDSEVAAITSITYDHMDILGHTLSEIAKQKAGIIKPQCHVVCLKQHEDVMKVVYEEASRHDAQVREADTSCVDQISYGLKEQRFSYCSQAGTTYQDCVIHQSGSYQIKNAIIAIEVIEALQKRGYAITEEHIYKGLERAYWPGRFSVISEDPMVIIDGAHNPDGAKELEKSIRLYLTGKKIIYIIGVFADKEYEKILEITAPYAEQIFTIETPGNGRALSCEQLKAAALNYHNKVEAVHSIKEAVKKSIQVSDDNSVIIAFGSLSHLKYLYQEFKQQENVHG